MIQQELLNKIKEKVTLITDPGLDIEVQDFFTWYEVVDTYSIKITDDNIYKIMVKLKKLNMREAKDLFSKFVEFIKYSDASFMQEQLRKIPLNIH